VKRRAILRSLPAAVAVPALASADRSPAGGTPPSPPVAARPVRMVVGCQRGPTDDKMLGFFKRHGVDHISGAPVGGENAEGPWTSDVLPRLKERCDKAGIALDMIQFPFMSSSHVDRAKRRAIMLGQEPEREKELEEAVTIIRQCAAIGIPAIKYNLSVLGVLRTPATTGRGGTKLSTWHLDEVEDPQALTRAGVMPAEAAWERITHFLTRIVPIATEHKIRLACHPHDPGVPAAGLHGVARVLGTVEGLKRFVDIAPSPYHGLNLCLGTVAEMLQDPRREIHDVIRWFGKREKIFNIHFRNIRGRRDRFQEVFPDEGDMDMAAVLRTLHSVDYPYMVMPDHMPTHPDDPGGHQAFAFGYGYIKALIQAVGTET
jgi:mannonate dehydratase